MILILLSLCVLSGSAMAALLLASWGRWSERLGAGGAVLGCGVGLAGALPVFLAGKTETFVRGWQIPMGSFSVAVDGLSAVFLIPMFLLCGIAAVFGYEYLAREWRGRRSLGSVWFFYNLLVAGMTLVFVARNAMLFLMAWEVMALVSFFLVTFEQEKESVRRAGWIYLVATHLGTAFLFVLFAVMGHKAGSLDFERFLGLALPAATANLLFLLAVVGFGAKAGFPPLHVWLPEAHPAAPSPVSAVMSGIMIKTGIYGILRMLGYLGAPPLWWGGLLIVIGIVAGLTGILFALAQSDLKRLLAYSSVENIGIIALGMGLGLLGISTSNAAVAVGGFGGALLHVVNHSLFKGLLFLGAGSVVQATETRELERLGGLGKSMPRTAALFLLAATALCALPPLNGFLGEFLIYLGAYQGLGAKGTLLPAYVVVIIGALALIGGLTLACFAKVFGIVFLGEPRSALPHAPRDPGWCMQGAMAAAAFGCIGIGAGGPWLMATLSPTLAMLTRYSHEAIAYQLHELFAPLLRITLAGGCLVGFVGLLSLLRSWLLMGRKVETEMTWDCGYVRPSARMQYTGSSFAQPLTALFHVILNTRKRLTPPRGLFPASGELATHTPDVCSESLFRPLFEGVARGLSRFRRLQEGRVQVYILYIALTLLAILIWKMH